LTFFVSFFLALTLTPEELQETLLDAYKSALDKAALEAFEGIYEAEAIAAMVDRNFILNEAMQLITAEE
jgi:hypothetical protein